MYNDVRKWADNINGRYTRPQTYQMTDDGQSDFSKFFTYIVKSRQNMGPLR